jgi:toxin ParE1/3/4
LNSIVWSRRALLNLQAIRDYIAQFNPYAVAEVAAEIIETGTFLLTFPQRGRIVRGTEYREVTTSYPYVIRYRIGQEEIVILRIRHMARGPT